MNLGPARRWIWAFQVHNFCARHNWASRANEFLAPQDRSAAELVGPAKFCWEPDSPVKKDSTRRLPNAALSPSRVTDGANFGGRCWRRACPRDIYGGNDRWTTPTVLAHRRDRIRNYRRDRGQQPCPHDDARVARNLSPRPQGPAPGSRTTRDWTKTYPRV